MNVRCLMFCFLDCATNTPRAAFTTGNAGFLSCLPDQSLAGARKRAVARQTVRIFGALGHLNGSHPVVSGIAATSLFDRTRHELATSVTSQDPAEQANIVGCLVEIAPETDSDRGIDLLLNLISDATLKVSVA